MITYNVTTRPTPPPSPRLPGDVSQLAIPTARRDPIPPRSCREHGLEPVGFGNEPAMIVDRAGREVCPRCAARAILNGRGSLGTVEDSPACQQVAGPLRAAQDAADDHAAELVRRGLARLLRDDPDFLGRLAVRASESVLCNDEEKVEASLMRRIRGVR
jgi:hypothetical protein